MALFLRHSRLGQYAFVIGSDENAARLEGVSVRGVKLAIYSLAGLFAGLAGAMQFVSLGAGDPSAANRLELQVIAAVVIGGGSFAGGKGAVLGTIIGCLILSVSNFGLTHAVASGLSQDLLAAMILIGAASLDRLRCNLDRRLELERTDAVEAHAIPLR